MMNSDRIKRFQQNVTGKADFTFLPFSADLTYLTGVSRELPSFGLLIHPGDWLEGIWLAPEYEPVLMLTRMSAEYGSQVDPGIQVRILGDFDDPFEMVRSYFAGQALQEIPSIAVGDRARAETLVNIQKLLPGVKFCSATELLRRQRMIKDENEIELIKKAGEITEAAFRDTVSRLKHGMTELDVVSEIDYQLRRHGALGPSFTTSLYTVGPQHELVFGNEQKTWPRKLFPPVSVLFDFGAVFDGYCYDYGRTVAFGLPTPEFFKVHQLVMASQQAGISGLHSGNTASQVDRSARRLISDAGFGEAFRHRLGHGIGLDVHEPPFLTQSDLTVLQPGMCFTVEPSILFPDRCSARVEDIVLVGEKRGVPLTSGFQELIVIE